MKTTPIYQGFIQDFEVGDGSRMIVALWVHGSGGMPPQKKFEFRSSQITPTPL